MEFLWNAFDESMKMEFQMMIHNYEQLHMPKLRHFGKCG